MPSPHVSRSASSALAGNGHRSQPRDRLDRSQEQILAALTDVVTVSPPPERAHYGHRSVPSQSDAASYAGVHPMAPYEAPTSLPGTSMVPGEDPLALNAPPPVPSAAEKPAPQPPQKAGMAGKFASAFRRQTAEEKAAKRSERQKRANGEMGRSKTVIGSSRMDVIDKLDLSGIHGSSMFHHDSPYDACTPHANRSSKKAPVRAFDPNIDPMTGLPRGNRDGSSRRNADALTPSMQKLGINDNAPAGQQPRATRSYTSPMVPSLPMTGNDPSTSAVNLPGTNDNGSLADTASHSTDTSDMDSERYRASRGATSNASAGNAVADMWGHVAEPWQDFAAPKSKAKKGRSQEQGKATASPGMLSPYSRNGSRDGVSSAASSVFDMEAVMTGKSAEEKRRAAADASPSEELAGVSPFPEPDYDRAGGGAESTGPKRSKSLIKRIKSARQYPNVPPPDDDVLELQGRNASRRNRANTHKYSPSSPATGDWSGLTSPGLGIGSGSLGRSGTRKATAEEQLRYNNNRAASGNHNSSSASSSNGQATPASGGDADYFESSNQYLSADDRQGRSPTEGPSGGGLGRSGSIFGRFSRKKSAERGVA